MGLKIEAGKQYVTRDGKRVRVFATDGGGNTPILGAFLTSRHVWIPMSWREDGRVEAFHHHRKDIVAEDDWRQEIPWNHIHPDIKWIARNVGCMYFTGFRERPQVDSVGLWFSSGPWINLAGVAGMPQGPENWRDTLAERP